MNSTRPIAKLKFNEPCRNLPSHKNGKGKEWFLAYRFAQAYLAETQISIKSTKRQKVVIAREIPANGYGIADLVAVNWQSMGKRSAMSLEEFQRLGRPLVRAFEIKVGNWRQALIQAHRYRFFAHSSIVVLPFDRRSTALEYIGTFQLLKVGLWSFDVESKKIIRYYTPRSRKPQDARQEKQAVLLVGKATKSLPVS